MVELSASASIQYTLTGAPAFTIDHLGLLFQPETLTANTRGEIMVGGTLNGLTTASYKLAHSRDGWTVGASGALAPAWLTELAETVEADHLHVVDSLVAAFRNAPALKDTHQAVGINSEDEWGRIGSQEGLYDTSQAHPAASVAA